MTGQIQVNSLRASVCRVPIDTPVATSFGIMRDGAIIPVQDEDADGARGWGEAWCNYQHFCCNERSIAIRWIQQQNVTVGR